MSEVFDRYGAEVREGDYLLGKVTGRIFLVLEFTENRSVHAKVILDYFNLGVASHNIDPTLCEVISEQEAMFRILKG